MRNTNWLAMAFLCTGTWTLTAEVSTAGQGTRVLAPSRQMAPSEAAGEDGKLRLAALFGNDMVLQRDMEVPVWGWAEPGAVVRVTRDEETTVEATAGADGKWMAHLAACPAGGPHQLAVTSGKQSITFENVMMGDVWICSGQSNMQWPIWVKMGKNALYAQYPVAESANAVYPNIRLFLVPMTTRFEPQEDIPSADAPMYPNAPADVLRKWRVCTPESAPPFSAVAYFFGRAVHRDVRVPVGLIQTAWGGTVSEAWTSADTLGKHPDFGPPVTHLSEDAGRLKELIGEYEEGLVAWRQKVEATDAGYAGGKPAWNAVDLDDSAWSEIELPNLWETQGFRDLDGYVWFRREINLPEAWAGKDLELHLTGINDANQAWFGGVQIADFADQPGLETPRQYVVPGRAVKGGANVITVRVYDMGNNGGFVRSTGVMELLNQEQKEKTIPLSGRWKMRIGVELKDLPGRPQMPIAVGGNPNVPTVLYNSMIAPLIPYAIKGAIWYQGESNAGRAYQYRSLFPALIEDWRAHWGQGDFPFLFVQLANFQERKNQPAGDAWAELREAQLLTLSLPNTGMAVTIDIGDAKDVHPKNKQDVGERLALAARHVAYGEKLTHSGPIYRCMETDGDTIRLRFDHVGNGLVAQGGSLTGFAIAGKERKFVWAEARIEGETVVVRAPGLSEPIAVRYAWATNPFCNLFNVEGLPASPFRTDDWPGLTAGKR